MQSGLVQKGDILYEVDSVVSYRRSIDRIQGKILGAVGSWVSLVFKRPSSTTPSRTGGIDPIESLPAVTITLQRRAPPPGHQLGVVEEPRRSRTSDQVPRDSAASAALPGSSGGGGGGEGGGGGGGQDELVQARPSQSRSGEVKAARGVLAGRKLHADLLQVSRTPILQSCCGGARRVQLGKLLDTHCIILWCVCINKLCACSWYRQTHLSVNTLYIFCHICLFRSALCETHTIYIACIYIYKHWYVYIVYVYNVQSIHMCYIFIYQYWSFYTFDRKFGLSKYWWKVWTFYILLDLCFTTTIWLNCSNIWFNYWTITLNYLTILTQLSYLAQLLTTPWQPNYLTQLFDTTMWHLFDSTIWQLIDSIQLFDSQLFDIHTGVRNTGRKISSVPLWQGLLKHAGLSASSSASCIIMNIHICVYIYIHLHMYVCT